MKIKKDDIRTWLTKYKGRYFVYILRSKGVVIYVGCSKNIYKRLKEHKYQKGVNTIELFSMPNQRTAKNKEKELIYKYKPRHNGNAKKNKRVIILNSDLLRKTSIQDLKRIHSILNR